PALVNAPTYFFVFVLCYLAGRIGKSPHQKEFHLMAIPGLDVNLGQCTRRIYLWLSGVGRLLCGLAMEDDSKVNKHE
ncbi:MAG TPA: hypothetical protein VHM28_12710, partial [Anaerolineales bacterium]|nr:hypothetical protein [Anaerolineales bacterium]